MNAILVVVIFITNSNASVACIVFGMMPLPEFGT
jgi:hypothetical protein